MRGKEVFLLLVALVQCCLIVQGIKIAAFNVRVFGTTKLKNELTMNMITQIVHEYDIIVIQEVRGFNYPTKVPNGILDWVNQGENDYAICNSALNYKPKGSSHRELQLFLYRPAVVTCVRTDEAESVDPEYANRFRRPPTVGLFRVTSGSTAFEFFVVGIHTQPTRAVTEINTLVDVYNTFRELYGTDIAFIIGDYNYGGSYVSSRLRSHLDIDQPPFVRLINNTDGTTVKPFDQSPQNHGKPYDRIYVVPGGSTITAAGVDKFRGTLTPEQYYKSVSDHYPVYTEVSIGNDAGSSLSNLPINQNQLAAKNHVSVEADVDLLRLDDDVEADLLNHEAEQQTSPCLHSHNYLICVLMKIMKVLQ